MDPRQRRRVDPASRALPAQPPRRTLSSVIRHETQRLTLRELTASDAPFVLALLTEPDFIRFIGDRGVHTLADAARYIEEGPRRSYAAHGHGLLAVVRRADGEALGICGLVRREGLPAPDLGFALLARHTRQGYAAEAARAVLAAAPPEVLAIADPTNERSIRLLEELEFRFEGMRKVAPETKELALFRYEPLEPAAAQRTGAESNAEGDYSCPHCGERIVIPLDVAAGDTQSYVEDCPVCCGPNLVHVTFDDDGAAFVSAEAE